MTLTDLAARPVDNSDVHGLPGTLMSIILPRRRGLYRPRASDTRVLSVDLRGQDALCAAPLLAEAAASSPSGSVRRALEETCLLLSGADPYAAFALTLPAADARIVGHALLEAARPPLDRWLCAALARVAMTLMSAGHAATGSA